MRGARSCLVVTLAVVVPAVACGSRDAPGPCGPAKTCPAGQVCEPASGRCVAAGADAAAPDGGSRSDTRATGNGPSPAAGGQSCVDDRGCTAPGRGLCLNGFCVACALDSHCPPERPLCSADNTCLSCIDAAGLGGRACPAERPHCEAATGRCLGCLDHGSCADPQKPICDQSQSCVACTALPAGCADRDAARRTCAPSGACVECVTGLDCTEADKPVCAANRCQPCRADFECAGRPGEPAICLHQTGRCARAAETIFVRKSLPCDDTAAGRAELPFCRPQRALDEIAAGDPRRVVALLGQAPLNAFEVDASAGAITLVGQGGVVVLPGSNDPGVRVLAGEVYLRGLEVRESLAQGVLVAPGATLHLGRAVLTGNRGGGLLVAEGAGFFVENSVFAGNGRGVVEAIVFGGAYLGQAAAGRPAVFRFNTVVGNEDAGVVCTAPAASQGLWAVLLADNGEPQRNCTLSAASRTDPPQLSPDRPFHLGPDSPCREGGETTEVPADDVDGEPRPQGARSDCGADEFHP